MKVLTTENVMLHLHGKTQSKRDLLKTHTFLQFCIIFPKNWNNNADISGTFHQIMMVFTIHMLRAQERVKHCWQAE